MKLTDSITAIPGVGEANARKLARLGIFRVNDLVRHFPYRYEDLSEIRPIRDVRPGEISAIRAVVSAIAVKRLRGGRCLVEALATDATGSIKIIWFNQSYLAETIKKDFEYRFAGQVEQKSGLQMISPVWEKSDAPAVSVGRIVPVYPLTAGVFPKWLRLILRSTLSRLPRLPDPLPEEVLKRCDLASYDRAVRDIHFPNTLKDAQRARRRLGFDEILAQQIKVSLHRQQLHRLSAPPIPFNETATKKFVAGLPFRLTASQKKAAWEIIGDLGRPHPANRLLCGDVGSGKTVVAAIAALQTLLSGRRTSIMAPTEILALQHSRTFAALPEFRNRNIALLTASRCEIIRGKQAEKISKQKLKQLLCSPHPAQPIDLVVGTHALLQQDVDIANLGLTIIDEQHRFGVRQRAAMQARLAERNTAPHLLSMTATPIPRTLALTVYGDLSISRIPELPAARKKVITQVVPKSEQARVYRHVEELIEHGQQIYVVCPLIDPSDTLGVRSATEAYEHMRNEIFPKRRIGLLHGKLKPAEKQSVLDQFRTGATDILVATTVVEVGIDVPNATIMIVEGAERFGLAQLHQLRGRVGRSDMQSYCYLMPHEQTQASGTRLRALESSHSGLELAEIDLRLRGPGELYGQAQSGYAEFQIADIFDAELIEAAHEEASRLLERHDLDRQPQLQKLIHSLRQDIHLE